MQLEKEHVFKKQGYTLHIINTEKYKTNTIVWKMKAPLQEETVTYRALLPMSCKAVPKTIRQRLHFVPILKIYMAQHSLWISAKKVNIISLLLQLRLRMKNF